MLSAYLQTDAGKAYLLNGNSGSGALGSKAGSAGGGKTMKRTDFDALDAAAKAKAINVDKIEIVD